MKPAALRAKAVLFFLASLLFMAAFLFLPAGTLDYWQAWLYLGVIFIPAAFVVLYFLHHDPKFLERRFKMKEKEAQQKRIVGLSTLFFLASFLVPGLDRRFGWSSVPADVSLAAALAVLLGYGLIFAVFRENSYAGRTIRVEKGQKVISTGPYSIVRHPMYVGVLLLYLATPLALGSWWAFPFFLFILPTLYFRILNEEEVLRRDLAGYRQYCKKVRWRLLSGVW